MSGLADIALAFCREVLDWDECRLDKLGTREYVSQHGGAFGLDYADLDAVTRAVHTWCSRRGLMLEITFLDEGDGLPWSASVERGHEESGSDLREVLLAACLAAARQMREAA